MDDILRKDLPDPEVMKHTLSRLSDLAGVSSELAVLILAASQQVAMDSESWARAGEVALKMAAVTAA